MLRVLNRSMRSAQLLKKNNTRIICVSSVRHLNLLEYQSKELLRDSGVSVQNFAIVDDLTQTNSALEKLREYLGMFFISLRTFVCYSLRCAILRFTLLI